MNVSSINGSGNYVHTFTVPQYYIEIYNDSLTTDVSVTVTSDTYVVKPYEKFYETVEAFTAIDVVASGSWRIITKEQNLDEGIAVNAFISSVRYDLKDKLKVKYSDFEIVEAVNTILRLINVSLVTARSNILLVPDYIISLDSHYTGTLPSDFMGISSVYDEAAEEIPNRYYKLTKNSIIYIGPENNTAHVYLSYYKKIDEFTITDPKIDLPFIFYEMVKTYTCLFLDKKIDASDQMFIQGLSRAISALSTTRDISYLDLEMPFMV